MPFCRPLYLAVSLFYFTYSFLRRGVSPVASFAGTPFFPDGLIFVHQTRFRPGKVRKFFASRLLSVFFEQFGMKFFWLFVRLLGNGHLYLV